MTDSTVENLNDITLSAPAFDTFRLGSLNLANRIVMAPMTRSRAYGPDATDAVHAEGGVIFAQLMHTGMKSFPVPHPLTEAEIAETVADFARAARNAIAAGFDGVELRGANGYLIHQFLSSNANQRTDSWGRTVEGRVRFALEVAAAVVAEIGPDQVGIRVSPGNPLHDIVEDDLELTYKALIAGLADLGLVYVHLMESPGLRDLTQAMRAQWPGAFILNPATRPEPTGPDQLALIEDGTADLISYGGLFLANPDLPARLAVGGPFNVPDRATSFGGDHRGYTDYPTLTASAS